MHHVKCKTPTRNRWWVFCRVELGRGRFHNRALANAATVKMEGRAVNIRLVDLTREY